MPHSRRLVTGLVASAAATAALHRYRRHRRAEPQPSGTAAATTPEEPSDDEVDTIDAPQVGPAEAPLRVETPDVVTANVTSDGPRRRMVRAAAGSVSLLSLVALLVVALSTLAPGSSSGDDAGEMLVGTALDTGTRLPTPDAVRTTSPADAPSPSSTDPTPTTDPAPTTYPAPTTGDPIDRADPTRVSIPAIDVDASVIPLGVTDGVLDVPQDFARTGWWQAGPEPGEAGPAVIVGHVDSYRGPAVFHRLRELRAGDEITVDRVDGSSATFAVRSVMRVTKDAFPTDVVYGDTDGPWLRLITCDGDFADGSYLGNLIVNAELLVERPADTAGIQT